MVCVIIMLKDRIPNIPDEHYFNEWFSTPCVLLYILLGVHVLFDRKSIFDLCVLLSSEFKFGLRYRGEILLAIFSKYNNTNSFRKNDSVVIVEQVCYSLLFGGWLHHILMYNIWKIYGLYVTM